VLIVSASMGAGHDRAAAELAKRLEADGTHVEIVDFLHLMPFGLGTALRRAYEFQLRRCAWTYELGYRLLGAASSSLWTLNVFLLSILTRHSISRRVVTMQPDVVVSTYPFASLVLGHLRMARELQVPVVTYLTDFAVHPLWVHAGVDLHLAVSEPSAQMAAPRRAAMVLGTGPLVDQRFRSPSRSRVEMRHDLGIPAEARVALVVAGSLGLGTVPNVVEAVTGCGYHVIAVCGRNAKLQERLIKLGGATTVLGWTDEMPELMGAVDVLVENAGGLTAMEAFAAGLPVVTYRAIAGHGRDNARWMSNANVSRYARTESELSGSLEAATTPGAERDALISAGGALFAHDPAVQVGTLAATTPDTTVAWVPTSRAIRVRSVVTAPLRLPRSVRRVAIPLLALFMVYGGLTEGAEAVAAVGVGVAKPPAGVHNTIYLGVRLTAGDLRDAPILDAVATARVTAIVDARVAATSRSELQQLVAAGIDVANGGWGIHAMLPWTRSRNDCQKASKAIALETRIPTREFVPGRDLNAFDEFYCRSGATTSRLVRPNHTFGTDDLPEHVRSARIYVLDGSDGNPNALQGALAKFEVRVKANHLRIRPLSDLR
jgi:UDP-N-acetylglucosamine:LPS N-acetylglucosamine transferase